MVLVRKYAETNRRKIRMSNRERRPAKNSCLGVNMKETVTLKKIGQINRQTGDAQRNRRRWERRKKKRNIRR